MNRGSTALRTSLPLDDRASMRPRFMNRGSEPTSAAMATYSRRFNEAPIHESGKCARSPVDPRSTPGFNEAPIHESGKFTPSYTTTPTMSCFNEAPIHESGKCGSTSGFRGPARCFNEAPIHESGKWRGARHRAGGRQVASMRPRFMNRGSTRARSGPRPRSCRFNEAPIHESGKLASKPSIAPPDSALLQ